MDEINGKEFSRIVAVERINNISAEYNIEANQKEREELSSRFSLVSMKHLKAHFVISRAEESSGYLIKGKVFSEIIQSCSVTLVDVPATLEVTVEVIACKQRAIESGTEAHLLDLEEDDVECIDENGCVDIGEIASQYLSLDLDPYPRAAGLPILEGKDEPNDKPDVINPFLVLQKLKK